jgi:hypothetical protein
MTRSVSLLAQAELPEVKAADTTDGERAAQMVTSHSQQLGTAREIRNVRK